MKRARNNLPPLLSTKNRPRREVGTAVEDFYHLSFWGPSRNRITHSSFRHINFILPDVRSEKQPIGRPYYARAVTNEESIPCHPLKFCFIHTDSDEPIGIVP